MMNNTKMRILRAAEELLSRKGAAETTISEIAKKAKVVDSHAYQYFKGKNGIVFSIAEERLSKSLALLEEQLEGILDPKSQLSKFIWYGLNYNDSHRDYVRNLVFDYRSNIKFYETEAYKLIRKHAGICGHILKQGVEKNVFRKDIDIKLIREIIYGTLDAEAISCVLIGEIDKSTDDWEDILSILLNMIEFRIVPTQNDKKLKIIDAAENVFGELGFNNAKISEIAKRAGVAEGSIYDYFKNKEDLLLSISKFRIEQLNHTFEDSFQITSPVRKLRRLLKLHFAMFHKNMNFFKVFVFDTLLNRNFYNSDSYDHYKNYQDRFTAVVEEGKDQGVFRKDINTRVFTNMFFGTFMHMALRWLIFDDQSFDKMDEVDTIIDLFTTAATLPAE